MADDIPTGAHADRPPVQLRYRPVGKEDQPAKFILACFAMCDSSEVARLIMEEAQIAYDLHVWWLGSWWLERGKSEASPFGALPVLKSADGLTLSQSAAIARHLAQLCRLDGAADPTDRATVDMWFEAASELQELRFAVAPPTNLSELASATSGTAARLLTTARALNQRLTDNIDEGILVLCKPKLTFADLRLFHSLNVLEATRPGCLAELELKRLVFFRARLAARPRLAAYAASPRCFPLTLGTVCQAQLDSEDPSEIAAAYAYVKPLSPETVATPLLS